MNRLLLIAKSATAAIMVVLLVSCGGTSTNEDNVKPDDTPDNNENAESYPEIYIVGSNDDNHPVIWNGTTTELLPTANGQSGNAKSIALGSGHTYIAGYTGNFPYTPCVWVDGIRNDLTLTDGTTARGEAYTVTVSGTDIYVSGCAWDDSESVKAYTPGYWKYSGSSWIWNQLAKRDGRIIAAAIDGNGNAVFAEEHYYSNALTLYYWKISGGAYTENICAISSDSEKSGVTGIGILGSSIIVAGYQGVDSRHPCYWTDGVRTDLSGTSPEWIAGMAVSGGKVYIAGQCNTKDLYPIPVPGYWADGVWTELPRDGSMNMNTAYSIAISGSDIYVTGQCNTSFCFWKNGKRVPLEGIAPESIVIK